ncbi:hypothetical protein CEW81_16995 [Kluyvera genomosp. 3]|uniref:Uncharacterized protein n=1 Tax=Kluyvera genomosp. 3 TaxID=2774055 RepID=A0A248KJE7_9ENTR|nr:hypothetical protein CEW81_16995 [Kluyvera genomosp. 3]
MAKVIIELTRDFTCKQDAGRTEILGVVVSIEDRNPDGKIGPQDVLAAAIKQRIPQVIKEAGEEVAALIGKFGISARSEMMAKNANQKH